MISACGARWRRYEPTPLIKPPPPVAMNMASRSGNWRVSSTPMVPCPATTYGSLYGDTYVRPDSRAAVRAANSAASGSSPTIRMRAPWSRILSRFAGFTWALRNTSASMPRNFAAVATPRPWLPVEEVMTPAAAAAGLRLISLLVAPRSLNEPVRCNCSSLAKAGPVRAPPSVAIGTKGVSCTRE